MSLLLLSVPRIAENDVLTSFSDSSAPSKPTYSFGVPTKETTTSKAPQVAVAQSSSDKSDKQKIPSFDFGVPQKSQTEPAEKKKEGDSKPSEVKSFKPQAKFSFGAPDKSKETQGSLDLKFGIHMKVQYRINRIQDSLKKCVSGFQVVY